MVEYCYPECTTSVVTALSHFRKLYPDYRAQEIECVPYLAFSQSSVAFLPPILFQ